MPRPSDEQPPREDGGPRGEELPAPGPPAGLASFCHITENSVENRVKETLHKAFWDSLEEQLSASPQNYAWAIQLLQELQEALLSSLLLPWHNQLRSQIEEALDMELIRQEAEHGALDVHGLTMYVLGTMAGLCVPVQDEEVRALQSLTDPAQLLREIFQVLGLMKMGMLNFTVQSLRTHLQDHTVQYERKKFQELLDKLPNSLDRTRQWLCKAAAQVSASSSQPPPRPAVCGSTCRTLAGGRQQ